MQNEDKRFTDRFNALFRDDGITNMKFFVRNSGAMRLSDFITEVSKIQDTIAAGDVVQVHSVDEDCEQRRFDASF